jgi:hypothetical protein
MVSWPPAGTCPGRAGPMPEVMVLGASSANQLMGRWRRPCWWWALAWPGAWGAACCPPRQRIAASLGCRRAQSAGWGLSLPRIA